VVLTFIETSTFTRLITGLVDDEDYATFQKELAANPEKGGPMSGCGGVRKVRMALPGKGKSGGARVCYLYLKQNDVIYLLYVFTKGDADNLSADGKRAMRGLAQQIKNEYP
jgi:hypothetical protein